MTLRVLQSLTVPWIPVPHRLDVEFGSAAERLPADGHTITSAFVFAVDSLARTLLARVDRPGRGWDVPGGHLEPGESARVAAARELAEETGLFAVPDRLAAVGGQRITLTAPPPAGYRYPARAYLAFHVLRLDTPGPDTRPPAGLESVEAAWLTEAEVRERCAGTPWLALHQAVLAEGRVA